jgi:branched-chain amino acid transport system ATP-binding protein
MDGLSSSSQPLLHVCDLVSGYGERQVLDRVSLKVAEREIVALIGPNGSGKSTVLRTIFGYVPPWSGSVSYRGKRIEGRLPVQNAQDGIGFALQGSRIYPDLTVADNLTMGGYLIRNKKTLVERLERSYALFPILGERRRQAAGRLSGGEKQMLALACSLMLNPRLLLLDEPSLGLSPTAARTAMDTVQRLRSEVSTSILVVEQNVSDVLSTADRAYVMRLGRIALEGLACELKEVEGFREVFLS